MKKQNKTKIQLKKINVARLDKQSKQAIKGGTLGSFPFCNNKNTGSVHTAIVNCGITKGCLSQIIEDENFCGGNETISRC